MNDYLEAAGVDVYETDLGEFVLQVADEAHSHLVAPAIHRSYEDIALCSTRSSTRTNRSKQLRT